MAHSFFFSECLSKHNTIKIELTSTAPNHFPCGDFCSLNDPFRGEGGSYPSFAKIKFSNKVKMLLLKIKLDVLIIVGGSSLCEGKIGSFFKYTRDQKFGKFLLK